jgi:hypothetical protein
MFLFQLQKILPRLFKSRGFLDEDVSVAEEGDFTPWGLFGETLQFKIAASSACGRTLSS